MSPKWNYIFGATTITLIVGGVAYSIYKSKQAEKVEEDAIDLEEAKDIVARGKGVKEGEWGPKEMSEGGIEVDEVLSDGVVDSSKIVKFQRPMVVSEVEEQEAIEELIREGDEFDELEAEGRDLYGDRYDPETYEKYKDVDESTESPSIEPLVDFTYYEDGINPKEDIELRFEPSSDEARHQYIRMELAEWRPDHDVYRILIQLFEIPFVPHSDGDEMLRTQIIDHKVQFYGYDSKWVKEVAFADVIFHYARLAEFNCGESVQYWVEYFLDFNEFTWDSSSRRIDELVDRLNKHSYFNEETQTFGLFGLTRNSMNRAIEIAGMNIEDKVTYSIEFNEFLKSVI